MRKILIANRGEIAVRIIRACRDMQIATVAVYSECDRAARHVRMADQAVAIGGNAAVESYLRIDRVVEAARRSGADAVHPGYGFLAENEEFVAACCDGGLTFIGPTVDAVRQMGSKTRARQVAMAAGVPVVPGTEEALDATVDEATITAIAARLGYPVMIKAVAGGGGKGMRVVEAPPALAGAIRAARSEAAAAFGDASIYLERRLLRPRHVEVQVLGDLHGTVVPFVERECSIQRRHQKVIEETPSPAVSPSLRAQLASAAARVASAAGYTSAGTVEFLLDDGGRFHFLEMNTRLQVEHPITEMVTGVDLVQWQIRIARGERLDIDPRSVLSPHGHAMECRIYAEDPASGFMPSPGRITTLRIPGGPGIRDDGAVEAGAEVPIFYDPLISKLTAWGEDRPQAIARMRRALREYEVGGIKTTVPFFNWMLAQPVFVQAAFHTGYLDEVLHDRAHEVLVPPDPSLEEVAAIAAAIESFGRRPSPAGTPAGWRARAEGPGVRSRLEPADGTWKARARAEGLRS